MVFIFIFKCVRILRGEVKMPKHVTESVAATITAEHDFQGDLKTDVISESTAAAGVSIDQVLCKDAAITASSGFTGAVTGNVTGNLTGNVTGNITGNLTGNIASLTGNITVSADDSHDLGANDKRMANVFTKKISGEPFPGFMQRPKFEYSTTTAIKISAGSYYHCGGTKERLLYWDSELTYTFGSLGASDWSYLYLDDSAIDTADTNLVAIGQMTDATAEPAWSHTKHGWYNGDDLCIFAVFTTGASAIEVFYHDGGDYVAWDANVLDITNQDVDGAWVNAAAALTIPKFSTKADLGFSVDAGDAAGFLLWRTQGSTGGGHTVLYNDADVTYTTGFTTVITNSSQLIQFFHVNGTAVTDTYTHGWYFPNGM